jgi:sugar/nucleoside kinase (ribokinase family)
MDSKYAADTKKITLKLIEPQIIKMNVVDGIELDQNDAKEAIAEAVRLAEGKNYTILFDANVAGDISHEARDEFAKSPKRTAVAVVTTSLANKLLGNFFIKFHKPISSSRIFPDEQTAIEWLRTQLNKS